MSWDGTPSLAEFPDCYQKSLRLIRLMTIQGRSWAVGLKFERWTIGTGNSLQPGYIVLTKNDRRYPDGAEAILHVSAMESLNEKGELYMLHELKKWMSVIASFFKQKNGTYYIGGHESLPKPLTREEEAKTIHAFMEGDMNARDTLIEKNLRLVVYIARRFDNTNTHIEDLISIGAIGLIKAIETFKIDKNIKLATYASRCIENEILMHLRKTNRTTIRNLF